MNQALAHKYPPDRHPRPLDPNHYDHLSNESCACVVGRKQAIKQANKCHPTSNAIKQDHGQYYCATSIHERDGEELYTLGDT